MPDSFRDRWNGDDWRWWALATGVGLTGATIGITWLVALLIDGEGSTLVLLGLTIDLLVIGLIGSGMLEGLSSRAIAGGLARQPMEDQRRPRRDLTEAERVRRDRKTIRAGLITLPVFVTFVVLLLNS